MPQHVCSLAFKNVKLFFGTANVFIRLLLFAIALWDVTIIIRDYINDNRLTLVKITNVNDTLPFLQNDPLRFCINYGNKTVFNEVWSTENPSQRAFSYLKNEALAAQIFGNDTATNVTGFAAFDLRVAAVVLMAAVQRMDTDMINRLLKEPNKTYVQSEYAVLNGILTNASIIGRLLDTWLTRQRSMIQLLNREQNVLPLHFLDVFRLCVGIPLSGLTPEQRTVNYYAGIVGEETFVQNNKMASSMELYLGDGSVRSVDGNSNTILFINNIGVFEKRITTECSNELAITFPYTSIPRGCEAQYARIFTKRCQCIPFAYRHQFLVVGAFYPSLPFCTPTTYDNCFASVREALINQPGCLEPCTVAKNNYYIASTTSGSKYNCWSSDDGFTKMCSRSTLAIQCTESVYAVYEERFRYSSSQLLSLIGGDFGLYTGVSFLGIWGLFSLFCKLYLSHRKQQAHAVGDVENLLPAPPTVLMTLKKTFLGVISYCFGEEIEPTPPATTDQGTAIEMSTTPIETRINILEEKLNLDIEAISELRAAQQQLLQRLEGLITKTRQRPGPPEVTD